MKSEQEIKTTIEQRYSKYEAAVEEGNYSRAKIEFVVINELLDVLDDEDFREEFVGDTTSAYISTRD